MLFSLRLKQGNAVTIYNETLMKLQQGKERKGKESGGLYQAQVSILGQCTEKDATAECEIS